jgi:hypothetical protein
MAIFSVTICVSSRLLDSKNIRMNSCKKLQGHSVALPEGPGKAGIGQRRGCHDRVKLVFLTSSASLRIVGARARAPRSGIEPRRGSLIAFMTNSCSSRDRTAKGMPGRAADEECHDGIYGIGAPASRTGSHLPAEATASPFAVAPEAWGGGTGGRGEGANCCARKDAYAALHSGPRTGARP